jgi:hypothetical protein
VPANGGGARKSGRISATQKLCRLSVKDGR